MLKIVHGHDQPALKDGQAVKATLAVGDVVTAHAVEAAVVPFEGTTIMRIDTGETGWVSFLAEFLEKAFTSSQAKEPANAKVSKKDTGDGDYEEAVRQRAMGGGQVIQVDEIDRPVAAGGDLRKLFAAKAGAVTAKAKDVALAASKVSDDDEEAVRQRAMGGGQVIQVDEIDRPVAAGGDLRKSFAAKAGAVTAKAKDAASKVSDDDEAVRQRAMGGGQVIPEAAKPVTGGGFRARAKAKKNEALAKAKSLAEWGVSAEEGVPPEEGIPAEAEPEQDTGLAMCSYYARQLEPSLALHYASESEPKRGTALALCTYYSRQLEPSLILHYVSEPEVDYDF